MKLHEQVETPQRCLDCPILRMMQAESEQIAARTKQLEYAAMDPDMPQYLAYQYGQHPANTEEEVADYVRRRQTEVMQRYGDRIEHLDSHQAQLVEEHDELVAGCPGKLRVNVPRGLGARAQILTCRSPKKHDRDGLQPMQLIYLEDDA